MKRTALAIIGTLFLAGAPALHAQEAAAPAPQPAAP